MSPAERIAVARARLEDAREIAEERREKATESLMMAACARDAGRDPSGWMMAADYAGRTAKILDAFADLVDLAVEQKAQIERLQSEGA